MFASWSYEYVFVWLTCFLEDSFFCSPLDWILEDWNPLFFCTTITSLFWRISLNFRFVFINYRITIKKLIQMVSNIMYNKVNHSCMRTLNHYFIKTATKKYKVTNSAHYLTEWSLKLYWIEVGVVRFVWMFLLSLTLWQRSKVKTRNSNWKEKEIFRTQHTYTTQHN